MTFGGAPGERMVPGLGTSVRPTILDETVVDDVIHVSEPAAIAMSHSLARHGFLFGGSTGTVLRGTVDWLRTYRPNPSTVAITLSPDLGQLLI